MKTAILVAMAENGRSGRPLSGVLPYDQAVSQFKAAVDRAESPDPEFPVLEIWSGEVRSRRFKKCAALAFLSVPAATGPEAQSPSYDELKDALARAVAHIAELKDQIDAMAAPSLPAPEGANTTYNATETALSDVTLPVADATPQDPPQAPSAPASPGSLSPGRRRGGGGNGTVQ
jgi:hypothetical protein